MLVRVAAAKVISTVICKGVSLNVCLPDFSERVSQQDQALLNELCYGTLRYYPSIKKVISQLLDKPLKKKDHEIVALMASALYQLSHTRIPGHAAVNESVAACKALQRPWAKGLVNALLRRFIREQSVIEQALASDAEYLFAHPQWLIEIIQAAWPEQAEAILDANNRRAPMTLRVNEALISRDNYLSRHCSDGSALATRFSGVGVRLLEAKPVTDVPGFDQGLVSVQDEAAQLAALLLDVQAGQRVLDACCAPGGKTCHILESAPELQGLVAVDIDPQRLERVRENLDRLQLFGAGGNIDVVTADVAQIESWWDEILFDRILLDAPCSATGVIRRHPDIKLLRKPEDIDKLAQLQRTMLTKLWPLLRTGGQLLYATCSVLPQENDDVIEKFIASQDDVELLTVNTGAGCATNFGRQLFPQHDGHDGFYYSLLEKT